MSVRVPTGPKVVGLETVVLPIEVQVANDAGMRACWVTAPTCRYGSAVYWPQIRFGPGGTILVVDGEEIIASGTCVECYLDSELPLQRVDLVLDSMVFEQSALSRLSPAELAEALEHPWQRIRESALLAVGQ